jgi:hydroxymethylbilane synthase
LAQTLAIRDLSASNRPSLRIECIRITTKGDTIIDRPLEAIDGKGLFVAEIEQALRDRRIDLAVHSAKDLPSDMPPDMALPVFPRRVDPRDVLVSRFGGIGDLPHGATVGTSSPRRLAQLRALRSDLTLASMRGNVDTRLRKLDDGEFDAIVLAAAGLERLGLIDRATYFFSPDEMLPSVAQGALALETRAGDTETLGAIAALNDPDTATAVLAERSFLGVVGGGCSVPVAAYAQVRGDRIEIRGFIGSLDGSAIRDDISGWATDGAELARDLGDTMLRAGGAELLERSARATAQA